jgi:hypothetical protein
MDRSLLNHSFLIVIGLAGMIGCSAKDLSGGSTVYGPESTTGAGGAGGHGGAGGAATSSSTSATSSSTSATSSSTSATSSSTSATSSSTSATSSSTTTGGAGGGSSSSTSGAGGGGVQDRDGDGWTVDEGDCCETEGDCGKPELVNPGAFEYLGNKVDDDCDPTTKDTVQVPDCNPPALVTPTSSDDLIRAMDLCQYTQEVLPKPKRKWGVIETALLLADGSPHPTIATLDNIQVGVLAKYGANVVPQKGATMAAISSGTARAEGDAYYVHPQNGPLGQSGNYVSKPTATASVPAEYLAAHNGVVPSPANCPACTGATCTKAFDSVNLRARIRVPTNALSFSYNFKFYTAEYPEFLCKQYNDFFVALLRSGAKKLPLDKNIASDAQGNAVSVNNGFFEVCFPIKPGECPSGTLDLVGTGMGGFNGSLNDGGGTEWLINDSPVVPGETITLDFIVWDAGDSKVDSLVLLDKFRFNVTPSDVGIRHE